MNEKNCPVDQATSCDRKSKKCNSANCTCPDHSCIRHGKCCECINYHLNRGGRVNCMR